MDAIRTAPSTDARPDLEAELPEWYAGARCVDADPAMFLPDQGQTPAAAIEVCRGCRVVDDCREYALADSALVGVWGGTTEQECRRLRREPGPA